ncbi:hypothetical protein Nepgr_007679 [Nepenthes gracilis]|uniref:Fe-S metabolism associated domain-containing protein n=1 Tax=Nepenthes gracilis TaxID=150966 RepID=A0AAD3S7N6_NEPGR|nr:hypothetical protein Nepgr_007679 [Nepenthes gracilis]
MVTARHYRDIKDAIDNVADVNAMAQKRNEIVQQSHPCVYAEEVVHAELGNIAVHVHVHSRAYDFLNANAISLTGLHRSTISSHHLYLQPSLSLFSRPSISSSFRLLTTKFPHFLIPDFPLAKPLISSLSPQNPPSSLAVSKSISFERLATRPQAMPSPTPSPPPLQPMDKLPPRLREIINLFQSVQEPKAKYEQLLFYGQNLSPLDDQYKRPENKVEGCVSQVWVRAYLDSEKNIWFEADSDSVLTKGLAALLVQGFSGRPVVEILRVSPEFVTLLGLQQSLTPSRNNGFLNMLRLMQKKALVLAMEAEKLDQQEPVSVYTDLGNENMQLGGNTTGENEAPKLGMNVDNGDSAPDNGLSSKRGDGSSNSGGGLGSRGVRIREILERELKPIQLEIDDISYQHVGHAGIRGSDGESHFNLKVVSEEFEGKSLVKRHRMIYALLQDELQSGLHALSIIAKTPAEAEGSVGDSKTILSPRM